MQKTLSILKPDAVAQNIIGQAIARYEARGLRVVAARMHRLTREKAEGFYIEHQERPFFSGLVQFMTSGPVLLLVLEGENAVLLHREIMGATDPAKAAAGTLRKDFAASIDQNVVHGSDSLKSAEREIAYFFDRSEICGRA